MVARGGKTRSAHWLWLEAGDSGTGGREWRCGDSLQYPHSARDQCSRHLITRTEPNLEQMFV